MGANIQALRERRNVKAKEARELMNATDGKKWTPENQSQYDALTGEITDIDAAIEREQKILDLEAEKTFERLANHPANSDSKPTISADRLLLNKWLRGGDKALNDAELRQVYNTMSTTTPAEGGYTVPAEVSKSVVDKLAAYGGMRAVATVIQTAGYGALSFPTSDGTAEEGEILAENVTATGADPTFGTVALPAYKYSSKIIAVPYELLQDSGVDVEAFIQQRMIDRLGRITNKHFCIGTGTGQPTGITVAASTGKTGTTGQTTTVIYDDLADLVESVDAAYLENPGVAWMMHQSSRKVLRKLKDTAGRPIWTPGYEFGIAKNVPDTLLGYSLKINNHMPVMAANAKSIAFGDFSKYFIRDVMNVSMFRFTDSAYTKLGQVGFLAWMRSGGNLIDTAAVKLYANSAT